MRRTVTEADNVWYSTATWQPGRAIHLDEQYCREHTEFGPRIVNSGFTFGLMIGSFGRRHDARHHGRKSGHGTRSRFPKPVFHGDTIRAETEVLELA